jgi:hypothetical protein
MNTIPGLRAMAFLAAAFTATANTTLASVGLVSPIAANQKQKLRFWLPFSVGAAGGIKLQVVIPAAATITTTIQVFDTVTPALITALQVTSTAFTNALAVAGNHWALVECIVTNSTTAGSVDLQAAQNSSNATPFTILAGAAVEVLKYN